ncbi:MAG: hypothetical protein K2O32_10545 [Acetatifactor sp.]|nr:hypothetical protein [Acetatifactor sp.]
MYFNHLENRKAEEPVKGNPMEPKTEQIKRRVEALLQTSKDANFTQYLLQMRERIANQERQMSLLADELESCVRMYEDNQRLQAQARGARPMEPQPPRQVVQPPQQTVQQPPQQVAQQPLQQVVQQTTQQVQPLGQAAQQLQLAEQPAPQQVAQQVQQVAQQPTRQEVQPPRQADQLYMQQPQGQAAKPKRNAEFTIGAAVLSIVGSVLILAAMVMFGFYFLQGLMKGLLLYAACIAVMLLSELLLYRRWPKLGMTCSAVGMGGLYIATLTNYLALKNFNQWVALGITLVITIGVIILSRRRDAVSYRILGMVAMYVSVIGILESVQYEGGLSQVEWVTITVMAFIINVMCLLVPVRKSHMGVNMTHMFLNIGFTLWVDLAWEGGLTAAVDSVSKMWHYPFFVAMSILVMQLIFIAQLRWSEKQKDAGSMIDNTGFCVVYCLSGFMYLPLVSQTTDFAGLIAGVGLTWDVYLVYRLICTGILVLICLVPMIALRKSTEKWCAWYLLNFLVLVIHLGGTNEWESSICLSILLAASKLLSFRKIAMTRYSDAALTAFACVAVLLDRESTHVIPLAVVLLLSVLCINYWHVYFETILTFTLAAYVSGHMLSGFRLPVFVGILFVGMLIFNNVKRWHGNKMEVYNEFMLAGQALCYLMLLSPVYQNAYLTYLCMAVFGIATIVICFQKKYHMDFSGKQMVLAVFLTYMGLIVRGSSPIINSILLMLIALGCVGSGFAVNKKSVRIYGLVLSLAVCVKIVLYDFMEAGVLQRTILFFAVGVLALIIAAIYMILERSQEKKNSSDI